MITSRFKYSLVQEVLFIILPTLSAIPSFLISVVVCVSILWSNKKIKTPYRRIIFIMSVYLILSSVAYMMKIFRIPRTIIVPANTATGYSTNNEEQQNKVHDVENIHTENHRQDGTKQGTEQEEEHLGADDQLTCLVYKDDEETHFWGASGNEISAKAFASLVLIGIIGSQFYSAGLSIYYLFLVRYNYRESQFRDKVEPFIHIIPLIWSVTGTAIVLGTNSFNPYLYTGGDYWITPYPKNNDCYCGKEQQQHDDDYNTSARNTTTSATTTTTTRVTIDNNERSCLLFGKNARILNAVIVGFPLIACIVVNVGSLILLWWTVRAQECRMDQYRIRAVSDRFALALRTKRSTNEQQYQTQRQFHEFSTSTSTRASTIFMNSAGGTSTAPLPNCSATTYNATGAIDSSSTTMGKNKNRKSRQRSRISGVLKLFRLFLISRRRQNDAINKKQNKKNKNDAAGAAAGDGAGGTSSTCVDTGPHARTTRRKDPTRRTRRRRQRRRSRIFLEQAIYVATGFLICFLLTIVCHAMIMAGKGDKIPFIVHLLQSILQPLQACFNILCFTRPHVKNARKKNPSLNYPKALWQVICSGCDNNDDSCTTTATTTSTSNTMQQQRASCTPHRNDHTVERHYSSTENKTNNHPNVLVSNNNSSKNHPQQQTASIVEYVV